MLTGWEERGGGISVLSHLSTFYSEEKETSGSDPPKENEFRE